MTTSDQKSDAINKAGENIRAGDEQNYEPAIIDEWRAAHLHVINTFQGNIKKKIRNKKIHFALRHKSLNAIAAKIRQEPDLLLEDMKDVAGGRLIFRNLAELNEFRDGFLKSKFTHTLAETLDCVKDPASSGYRGIHDVYAFDPSSSKRKHSAGLYIELQYRTACQHAWASAVEVVGQSAGENGDLTEAQTQWFKFASEILARTFEDSKSCHSEMSTADLLDAFEKSDADAGVFKILNSLETVALHRKGANNMLFTVSSDGELEMENFRSAMDAQEQLFTLEKDDRTRDVVLVAAADNPADIGKVFQNYLKDVKHFVGLLYKGRSDLRKSVQT